MGPPVALTHAAFKRFFARPHAISTPFPRGEASLPRDEGREDDGIPHAARRAPARSLRTGVRLRRDRPPPPGPVLLARPVAPDRAGRRGIRRRARRPPRGAARRRDAGPRPRRELPRRAPRALVRAAAPGPRPRPRAVGLLGALRAGLRERRPSPSRPRLDPGAGRGGLPLARIRQRGSRRRRRRDGCATGAGRSRSSGSPATRSRTTSPGALGAIRTPTLLLWGAEDRITPPDVARRFRDLIAGSRLLFVPDAGHAPMIERPSVFAFHLSSFLNDLSPHLRSDRRLLEEAGMRPRIAGRLFSIWARRRARAVEAALAPRARGAGEDPRRAPGGSAGDVVRPGARVRGDPLPRRLREERPPSAATSRCSPG